MHINDEGRWSAKDQNNVPNRFWSSKQLRMKQALRKSVEMTGSGWLGPSACCSNYGERRDLHDSHCWSRSAQAFARQNPSEP